MKHLSLSRIVAGTYMVLAASTALADPVKNIVLVHGAFVDGSIWNGVSERLMNEGFNVRAVQLPLTSLTEDVAATEAVLDRLDGPTLMVGYSWGGVPATVAGTDPDVIGLVYFAAVTPSPGESLGDMLAPYGEMELSGSAALQLDEETNTYWMDPDGLHDALCHDAPASAARLMAASQKPTSADIFVGKPDRAAWQAKPSWYVIATEDHIFPVPLQYALAEKIGATVTEWPTGHAAILSRPGASAALIAQAAHQLDTQTTE